MANQILLTVIGTPNFTMSFSTDEVRLAQSSGTTQANSVLYIDEYNSFPILQSIADVATLAGSAMIQATIMPQNIAALFPSSSKIVGVTRGSNGINSYIQFKNQTFYLAQTQSSLVTAANSGGNGGGGFPAQLDVDTTVDLNGKVLRFAQGGNDFLLIDPTVNAEKAQLQAYNTTGGDNDATVNVITTDTIAQATLYAAFNNQATEAFIVANADAISSTIEYTADTHTFNGEMDYNGNGKLLADRTVDLNGHSLSFPDGGGEDPLKLNRTVGFESSTLVAKDGIGTSYLDLESNVNSGYVFYLVSYNGTNTITIEGDAASNSLEYTAATHAFNGVLNLAVQAAPASPNDGDIWRQDNTNTGLKIRVNGVTKTITLS